MSKKLKYLAIPLIASAIFIHQKSEAVLPAVFLGVSINQWLSAGSVLGLAWAYKNYENHNQLLGQPANEISVYRSTDRLDRPTSRDPRPDEKVAQVFVDPNYAMQVPPGWTANGPQNFYPPATKTQNPASVSVRDQNSPTTLNDPATYTNYTSDQASTLNGRRQYYQLGSNGCLTASSIYNNYGDIVNECFIQYNTVSYNATTKIFNATCTRNYSKDGVVKRSFSNPTCDIGTANPVSCASGYTVNGSSCSLTDATKAYFESDGKCNVVRNGNVFTAQQGDPDCALKSNGGTQDVAPIAIDGNKISQIGIGGTGVKIETMPDGRTVISQTVPVDGTNDSKEITIGISSPTDLSNPAGTVVDSVSVADKAGQGVTATNPSTTTTATPPAVDLAPLTTAINDLKNSINSTAPPTTVNPDTGAEEPSVVVPGAPGLPSIPSLYTRSYPAGIIGVWQQKQPELMQTSFVQAIYSMAPSLTGTGTCPTFNLSMNMGALGSYGGDLPVPCWIWDIVGGIMLLSTAFTCRKIIFGG